MAGDWDFWIGLTFGEYPLQADPALRRHLSGDLNGNYLEVTRATRVPDTCTVREPAGPPNPNMHTAGGSDGARRPTTASTVLQAAAGRGWFR